MFGIIITAIGTIARGKISLGKDKLMAPAYATTSFVVGLSEHEKPFKVLRPTS